MIVTTFQNAERYYSLSNAIKTCVDYAKNNDLKSFEPGSYRVAEGIKVNINDFHCTATPKYEAHRKMVDIQIDLTGQEKCYVTNIDNGIIETPYNEDKDVEWFTVTSKATFNEILMNTDTLVILFPEDIHSPTIFHGCETIKKAIFKIDIELF
ncbi:MAG: YhcH/YjgK/YiaL family protein [Abditibacteriota bacterium]|nr:YhcH/YjgK/YiaL family protein [Abditibacteriota bacterium]